MVCAAADPPPYLYPYDGTIAAAAGGGSAAAVEAAGAGGCRPSWATACATGGTYEV